MNAYPSIILTHPIDRRILPSLSPSQRCHLVMSLNQLARRYQGVSGPVISRSIP